jgi:hypothetical protein
LIQRSAVHGPTIQIRTPSPGSRLKSSRRRDEQRRFPGAGPRPRPPQSLGSRVRSLSTRKWALERRHAYLLTECRAGCRTRPNEPATRTRTSERARECRWRVSPLHDPAGVYGRIKACHHGYLDAVGFRPIPHAWRCLHVGLACPRWHGWRRFRTIDHWVFVECICCRSRFPRCLLWRLRRPSAGSRRRLGGLATRLRCLPRRFVNYRGLHFARRVGAQGIPTCATISELRRARTLGPSSRNCDRRHTSNRQPSCCGVQDRLEHGSLHPFS